MTGILEDPVYLAEPYVLTEIFRVSTGGQVALSTQDLRDRGAKISTALCAIDRRDGGPTPLDDAHLELLALFTADELGGV